MPLYEYLCDACAHRFEVIQKFSDPPIEVCPTCGGVVAKLLSSPAIQFKGSGWYITDYARSGKSDTGKVASEKAEKQESGAASTDGASTPAADTKTDTKTEKKADTKAEPKTTASTKPD
jgi:putative FmdB family regulatory protein